KQDELEEKLKETASRIYSQKETALSPDLMRQLERYAILRIIDEQWKEHLYQLDQIKEGINLRAYGQRDPLIEYKKESFDLFQKMLSRLNEDSLSLIFKARIETEQPSPSRPQQQMSYKHDDATGMGYEKPPEEQAAARAGKRAPVVKAEADKVGRNDPCPCGSGKKYKKCHGLNK
ncbi:MAG: preprotein translocase subunit SecA, partial [Planctomycetes bacterium]|nr:preprotein translocase subunit SecA [Planctomycetota bacterium]